MAIFSRHRSRSTDDLGARLTSLANQARDEKRFAAAAALYDESLRVTPGRAGIHVQAGNMFKEAGDLGAAERHYRLAEARTPDDPDLQLQLGHLHKMAGRLDAAQRAYARAASLDPGSPYPPHELLALEEIGWVGTGEPTSSDVLARRVARFRRDDGTDVLAPELEPLAPEEILRAHGESIHIRHLGRRERTTLGELPVLRGVAAVRGLCLSEQPIVELQLLIDGVAVHRGGLETHPLPNEAVNPRLRKYIFNVWLDVTGWAPGVYTLSFRFLDASGTLEDSNGRRRWSERVVIGSPLPDAGSDPSDGAVAPTDPADPGTVAEQVNARPSIVRSARRGAFPQTPERVLVVRTDQLGDVVASVPALRRLRELLPDAHLVGLLTAANRELAETLGVFDEVIVADFPDVWDQRKRVMPLAEQERLRTRLAAHRFDLAIDLAPARESRHLLLLSGAPFLFGMGDWPWLTTSFTIQSRDANNRADFIPHSTKPLAMVETLGAMLRNRPEPVRRDDLPRTLLTNLGVGPDASYAVLHTGARIAFSRWHGYPQVAERLLAETSLSVVMLADDPTVRATLPPVLLESDRFVLLDQRLSFDSLDALLSHADLFVGNDSGPKHLASLRGTPVVSVHSARINWGEWAQEITGVVVSRKVPCAGCLLYHEPEDCGAGYACIANIRVEEVFDAAMRVMAEAPLAPIA